MSRILVTGVAGFIGMHVAERLLSCGNVVVGLDNLNGYYDTNLKHARLARLLAHSSFTFHPTDIADREMIAKLFADGSFDRVVHLAAQAGVRYSVENPHAYIESNIVGFMNVLEGCRRARVGHLVFASSSSVYGANSTTPFSVGDRVDHPVSLYAATKKSNELMAHSYSHLFGLPVTGLRFFTVYGPWGRPDMAYFSFTRAILEGSPIPVYNHGRMRRDFTYIDDIVEGILRVTERPPVSDTDCSSDASPNRSSAPYRIYNIGNNRAVDLLHFISVIERCLGRSAIKTLMPLQPGDVPETFANIDDLIRDTGFQPATSIEIGIPRFISWYRSYYGVMDAVPEWCAEAL